MHVAERGRVEKSGNHVGEFAVRRNEVANQGEGLKMGRKRKLTAAEKAAKKERKKKYEWIFINGKQVRVKREPTIDGMPVEEFIRENADPIWLQQNEMWEDM